MSERVSLASVRTFQLFLQTAQTAPLILDQATSKGGPVGIILVLCAVILYLAKENKSLHDTIHARDAHHAEVTRDLLEKKANEMAKVNDDRIEEMNELAKAVQAFDRLVRERDRDRGPYRTVPPTDS